MHIYSQSTGIWTMPNGTTFQGWAGNTTGMNNPAMQNVKDVGPLPQGFYTIGPWQDGIMYGPSFARLGPFITRLTPDPENEMFGRNDFCCHGANAANQSMSSDGCIIQNRPAREAIASSGENRLQVVG